MAAGEPQRTRPLVRLGWFPEPHSSPARLFPTLLPPRELAVTPGELWSVHVVGRPGFGKSVFLGNLALQFHQAGEGVLLIDVKGDLARSVVARAPEVDRVIYVAPHVAMRHDHYWSLNPLAFDRADRARFEFYANALPVIFERIVGYSRLLAVGLRRVRQTTSARPPRMLPVTASARLFTGAGERATPAAAGCPRSSDSEPGPPCA